MQMNKKYVYATNLHQFQSFTFLHITLNFELISAGGGADLDYGGCGYALKSDKRLNFNLF